MITKIFFLFRIKQKNFNQTSTVHFKNRKLEGTEIFFRFPWKPQKRTELKFRFPSFWPISLATTPIATPKGEPKFFFGSLKENRIIFSVPLRGTEFFFRFTPFFPHFSIKFQKYSPSFRPDSKFNFSQTATWNFVFFISN